MTRIPTNPRAFDDVDAHILEFFRRYAAENYGQPPSVRQICAEIDYVPSAVRYRLRKLVGLGALVHGKGARAYALVSDRDVPTAPTLTAYTTAVHVAMPDQTPLLRIVSSQLKLGKRYKVTISEVVE